MRTEWEDNNKYKNSDMIIRQDSIYSISQAKNLGGNWISDCIFLYKSSLSLGLHYGGTRNNGNPA